MARRHLAQLEEWQLEPHSIRPEPARLCATPLGCASLMIRVPAAPCRQEIGGSE